LAHEPSWLPATFPKNIVVLWFKPGTRAARRAAIVRLVNGRFIYNDRTFEDQGFYLVQVRSHPDACGVKQAIAVLERVQEVEGATAEILIDGDIDGPSSRLPVRERASTPPCPSGTSLLR
jgi:hypothetical protein